MFTWITTATRAPIEPSGQRVYSGATTGATARYRAGVPVEIWHRPDTFSPGIYRVFIAGRFTRGWDREDLATAYATRY